MTRLVDFFMGAADAADAINAPVAVSAEPVSWASVISIAGSIITVLLVVVWAFIQRGWGDDKDKKGELGKGIEAAKTECKDLIAAHRLDHDRDVGDLWKAVKAVEHAVADLATEMAKNYVSRETMRDLMKPFNDTVARLEAALTRQDAKLDSIKDTLSRRRGDPHS